MRILVIFIFIFIATLLFGCSTMKSGDSKADWAYFENWDTNGDERLSLAEFESGYKNKAFFHRWDLSKQKQISDSAFLHRMFSYLDRNNSGGLDTLESHSRRVLWSFPGQQELKNWDSNGDQTITLGEFMEHATQENIAQRFDITGDGVITEAEMAEAMFAVCDKDFDNQVRGLEFYLWEVYRR